MADEQATQPTTEATPQTTPTQAAAPEGKTLTQAEVDAIVKDRLTRERQKYADYEQLKAAATKLSQIEESQKTEEQKLKDALAKLEAEMSTYRQENQTLKLTQKVASIAGLLGAINPRDANFMQAASGIDPNGDGADKTIQEALESLKATHPYLFRAQGAHVQAFNPDGTSAPGVGQQETEAQALARIRGGGGSVWDSNTAKARGGGVFWGPPEK